MTSKAFVVRVILVTLFTLSVNILVSIFIDDYGLYRSTIDREIKIHGSERTSKYLLSHKYIPDNFEGILIGPSYGDLMMNTRLINGFKIYNLSLNGGNISELRILLNKVLERKKMRFVVICVDPYVFKDNGRKTNSITPKEYWSALGSVNSFSLQVKKIVNWYNPEANPYFDSGWGYYDSTFAKRKLNSRLEINKRLAKGVEDIVVHPSSLREFGAVLEKLHLLDIDVFMYFYPKHEEILKNTPSYDEFKSKIMALTSKQDIVWDFNSNQYSRLVKQAESFSDGSHLSKVGALIVLKEIERVLSSFYN
ncbi:MAG: hypothetical protein OEX19_00040 [Gammaproteobacteria bacterium]|nr:hypothetical protein [Gammaproteobacteria bacterium]